MNGRKTKLARRILEQQIGGDMRLYEKEHHNLRKYAVPIPSGQVDQRGFPLLKEFHFTTSTVVIPARRSYQGTKKRLAAA